MSTKPKYNYYEMPKSSATSEGMKIIEGAIHEMRAKVMPDITYITKDGHDLHLRILKPEPISKEEDTTLYPLIIHIQGSAYLKQNLNDHILDFKEIVTAGYMVAIVEYRDSSMVKIPGQVYDAKDAVRYIYKHHKELNVDINRLYLSGDSSGGYTALMCWATWNKPGVLDTSTEPLPPLQSFMDFYGAVDLLEMTKVPSAYDHGGINSAEGFALGFAADDPEMIDVVKQTSVLTYIDKNCENAPLLVIHGNKDRSVPFEQSVLLYNACKEAGKDITFYCVNNSDHGGCAFYCKNVIQTILNFCNASS